MTIRPLRRFALILSASASLAVSITGSAIADNKIIRPLQGEASLNYRPLPQKLAFRPVSNETFPLDLIASLSQSAISRKIPDLPIPNQSIAKATGKAILQFYPDQVNYRPSRSAAQSFLKVEPKDKPSTSEEELEKRRDELSLQVEAAMLEMARGLGEEAKAGEAGSSVLAARQNTLQSGFERMKLVVGEPEAKWALTHLKDWSSRLSYSVLENNQGTLEEFDSAQELARQAIDNDQQVKKLKALLAKYDVLPTNCERLLTTIGFIPVAAAPIANVAESGVEMQTGGSREKRLSDVISLGLKLQNRINFLTRECYLAASQIQRARSENNQVLFAFASDLTNRLRGQ